MANKTTKKHFEIFKTEADYWIKRFGLLDWEITYEDKCRGEFSLAELYYHVTARFATLRLGKEWPDRHPVNDREVRKSAFHEVCHLLIVLFDGANRNFDSSLAEDRNHSEVHAFIQRMVNAVWEVENAEK